MHLDDGRRQVQGDRKVLQALHDVAVEAVGVRHDLKDARHLDPFQRQAPRHDQPDVARPKDGDTAAGQHAVEVDKALRQPGRKHPRRPRAGDADGGARPFAAPHRQHHGARLHQRHACQARQDLDLLRSGAATSRSGDMSSTKASVSTSMSCSRLCLQHALGVLRPGEFLAKAVQAKAVVDALQQDAAGLHFAIDDQHALGPCRAGGDGRLQARPGPPPTTTTS